MKIQPVGNKLIVKPSDKDAVQQVGSVLAVDSKADEGVVVEVSDGLKDIYPIGSKIIYPIGSGIGLIYGEPQSPHLWLDAGRDDIWGIVS